LPSGGWEVAWQDNAGELLELGAAGNISTGLDMNTSSSPSITALPNGGFQVAFEANTDFLWTTGTMGTANAGEGMWPGSSPSIASSYVTGAEEFYEVAFQSSTAALWIDRSTTGLDDLGNDMYAGTSPSITAAP
jgi:hypothetical protein